MNYLFIAKEFGKRMFLEINFLHSHLEAFSPNRGDVAMGMANDFMNKSNNYKAATGLTDYCWLSKRETDIQHKPKRRRQSYFRKQYKINNIHYTNLCCTLLALELGVHVFAIVPVRNNSKPRLI